MVFKFFMFCNLIVFNYVNICKREGSKIGINIMWKLDISYGYYKDCIEGLLEK